MKNTSSVFVVLNDIAMKQCMISIVAGTLIMAKGLASQGDLRARPVFLPSKCTARCYISLEQRRRGTAEALVVQHLDLAIDSCKSDCEPINTSVSSVG